MFKNVFFFGKVAHLGFKKIHELQDEINIIQKKLTPVLVVHKIIQPKNDIN